MKDIARNLGISLMTVSKALRNHSDISAETRNRVLKRAQQLNYQPNWAARSLVTGRTHMVGLVIPDLMHSFFAEVAKGVARMLEPRGYNIIISNRVEGIAPWAEWLPRGFCFMRGRGSGGTAAPQANPGPRSYRSLG
jgi:LacI family transcriptional regulator